MAETGDDDSTFRLLRDEYPLFLKAAGQSEKLATKMVERFLAEGERDCDGRIRYKLWLTEAFPGGLTPSPYDGAFWCSYPERGICCTIEPWHSSARWTGPASAEWKAFDKRQAADYQIFGIRLNHAIVLEFLESVGVPLERPSEPASSSPSPASPSSASAPIPSFDSTTEEEQKGPAIRLAKELMAITFPQGQWQGMTAAAVRHRCDLDSRVKAVLKEKNKPLPSRDSFARAMGVRPD
jgi:hypothetical protein